MAKNLCEVPSLIESLRCFELLKQCVGDGELVSFKDRCAEGGKVAPQGGGGLLGFGEENNGGVPEGEKVNIKSTKELMWNM